MATGELTAPVDVQAVGPDGLVEKLQHFAVHQHLLVVSQHVVCPYPVWFVVKILKKKQLVFKRKVEKFSLLKQI